MLSFVNCGLLTPKPAFSHCLPMRHEKSGFVCKPIGVNDVQVPCLPLGGILRLVSSGHWLSL